MSRKNTLVFELLNNQSLSASFTSPATVIRNLDNCSFQINVSTSDSIGNFYVQVSNDYSVNESSAGVVVNPGNWTDLTLAGGTPFVAAADDTIVINCTQLAFYAVRLRYAASTPGTGVCSAYITHKQIGG